MSTTQPLPDTVPDAPTATEAAESAEVDPTRVFSTSILISAVRCTLTYVIFPWVMPLMGLAGGIGPVLGAIVGIVAIGFNVASIRRFWISDHRWKWPITILNSGVIVLLLVLLVSDLGSL